MFDALISALTLVDVVIAPWRFLLSKNYRCRKQQAWLEMYAPRASIEIVVGIFSFFISIAAIAAVSWLVFFR